MTKLNWLRYQHYGFWHRVFSLFPIYRDHSAQANRWCFVEMQVWEIEPPDSVLPWIVTYKAGGRNWTNAGDTLLEAVENAMAHAEGIERSFNAGAATDERGKVPLPGRGDAHGAGPAPINAGEGYKASKGDDAPRNSPQPLLGDKSPRGASPGIAESAGCGAESDPAPYTRVFSVAHVLICRDRDGACPTAKKCRADGCQYKGVPL